MRLLKSATAILVLLSVLVGPAFAAEDEFPIYLGDEFVALYDYAIANELPNLAFPVEGDSITGDEELDEHIWELAFERGYVMRPIAASHLPAADGIRMQSQAAAAWLLLREAAREEGHYFVVSSAYRSPDSQRTQFLSKLEGNSDESIDQALRWYSLPGTSKHHGGYALDFRYRDGTFAEFRSTPDYAWLAADNFLIPKTFGFIPSYPDGVANQGPNPEPWEFVWVGVERIKCGVPIDLSATSTEITEELASCPGELGVMMSSRGRLRSGPWVSSLMQLLAEQVEG
jgi:hypothetical protein